MCDKGKNLSQKQKHKFKRGHKLHRGKGERKQTQKVEEGSKTVDYFPISSALGKLK